MADVDATGREPNPFTDEVVLAVRRHMNNQHAEDNVLICRSLGRQPDTTSAVMTGMDGQGIDFLATAGDSDVAVRVPWSHPLTERAQVRAEVTRMYYEACESLGVAARPPAGR